MIKGDQQVEEIISSHQNLIEHFELFKKFGMIRFVYLPPREKDGTYGSVIIILNDSFSLWFAKNEDGWEYDGWEAGDYSEHNWDKFQLKPKTD